MEVLGQGKFGKVYKAIKNNKIVAVKTVSKETLQPLDLFILRQEIDILKSLNNFEGVVQLHEAYEDEKALNLVMECIEGPNLWEGVTSNP